MVDVFGGGAGASGLLVDVSWALGTVQVGGSLIDDILWGAAGLAGSLIGDVVRWDATGLPDSLVDDTSWWDTTWAAAGRLLACTLLGSVMVICKVDSYNWSERIDDYTSGSNAQASCSCSTPGLSTDISLGFHPLLTQHACLTDAKYHKLGLAPWSSTRERIATWHQDGIDPPANGYSLFA